MSIHMNVFVTKKTDLVRNMTGFVENIITNVRNMNVFVKKKNCIVTIETVFSTNRIVLSLPTRMSLAAIWTRGWHKWGRWIHPILDTRISVRSSVRPSVRHAQGTPPEI